jgi:ABC-2 type transport system permease protein
MGDTMIGKIWDIAVKDLLQLRKDRAALLMMFAVPLLLMAVLGSVFNSAESAGSVTVTLPVIDHDGGPQARALITALRHAPSLRVQMRHNQATAEKVVRDGDQVGLLIIPAGFSTAVKASHAHATYYSVANNSSVEAQVAGNTVQNVVQRFAFQTVMAGAITRAQQVSHGSADPALTGRLMARANQQLSAAPPVALRSIGATGRKTNGIDNTVPGYALMFALFALTAGAGSILEEKESGTFKRLLIAPLPPYVLLGGKLLAQFIQTLVQLTVLFVLGALLFKINLGPSIPALALIIVGTAFAATGLGMILVSFVRTQRQLRPVTTLIVLTFSALGGSWWPISIEPQWMQSVSRVTLNSWAMQGFNGLMIFDKSFIQVLPDIAALFAYGLVCFAVARRTFRFREG